MCSTHESFYLETSLSRKYQDLIELYETVWCCHYNNQLQVSFVQLYWPLCFTQRSPIVFFSMVFQDLSAGHGKQILTF